MGFDSGGCEIMLGVFWKLHIMIGLCKVVELAVEGSVIKWGTLSFLNNKT